MAKIAEAQRADDWALFDERNDAVIGAWTMRDGSLVRATVAARFDANA